MEHQLESIIVNCQKCEKRFEVMQSQLVWRKNCVSCWKNCAIAKFWNNCRKNEKVNEDPSTNTKRANKFGAVGISKNGKGYRAAWSFQKTRINIGTFPTIEEAILKRRDFIDNYKKEQGISKGKAKKRVLPS